MSDRRTKKGAAPTDEGLIFLLLNNPTLTDTEARASLGLVASDEPVRFVPDPDQFADRDRPTAAARTGY